MPEIHPCLDESALLVEQHDPIEIRIARIFETKNSTKTNEIIQTIRATIAETRELMARVDWILARR